MNSYSLSYKGGIYIKTFRKIINILILITLILLIYLVGKGLLNNQKSDKTYNDIHKIAFSDESKESPSNSSYNKLKTINPDYKFWMKINNTNIDYPVVKGTNNDFYLENDFYKKPLDDGSIFLDYKNNFDKDFNNIIFGHNMKNSNMFSTLNKFKDEDFFNSNNEITLTDKNYTYTYKVFSTYIVDSKDTFDYLYHINNDTYSKDKLNSYINLLKSKSIYESDSIKSVPSNILTLITCSYEFDDARTVVHAQLTHKTKNN